VVPGIDKVLSDAMGIPGALSASLIDWTSGLTLGTAGQAPHADQETTAADTAEVAQSIARNSTFASTGTRSPDSGLEDVIITGDSGYHLMRFVGTAFDSRAFLYVWLDHDKANLAIARRRLGDLVRDLLAT
jgi:hypothetical protein